MKKYHGHPSFYKLIEEEKRLHSDKNYQYANKEEPLSNFRRVGQLCHKLMLNPNVSDDLKVAMVNMAKQVDAVYDIVGESKEDTIESLEDKFRDISIYSKLCIILNKERMRKEE